MSMRDAAATAGCKPDHGRKQDDRLRRGVGVDADLTRKDREVCEA
jgi:hypothetical protein